MNIGLIAHDSNNTLMQNFCIAYRGILSKHSLATAEIIVLAIDRGDLDWREMYR